MATKKPAAEVVAVAPAAEVVDVRHPLLVLREKAMEAKKITKEYDDWIENIYSYLTKREAVADSAVVADAKNKIMEFVESMALPKMFRNQLLGFIKLDDYSFVGDTEPMDIPQEILDEIDFHPVEVDNSLMVQNDILDYVFKKDPESELFDEETRNKMRALFNPVFAKVRQNKVDGPVAEYGGKVFKLLGDKGSYKLHGRAINSLKVMMNTDEAGVHAWVNANYNK